MSDANTQEPTMEEILASIRRIISEDDAPPAAAGPEAAAEKPVAETAPAAAPAEIDAVNEDDDVLELTDPDPAPALAVPAQTPAPAPEPAPTRVESLGDLDVFSPPPRRPDPAPAPRAAPTYSAHEEEDDDGLMSPSTASQAASAFTHLSRSVAMPAEGRTLEDLVREMLRPMLKQWLDENLSDIVETRVQAEVERISRSR